MRNFALLASVASVAFMSEHPETVRIKRGGETFTINADDYDEKRDGKVVTDDAPEGALQVGIPAAGIVVPPAPSAPSFIDAVAPQTVNEDTYTLVKKGTGAKARFIVVRAADAQPVTGFKDIDEAGYATDTEAWAAIMAAKRQPHEQSIEPPHMPQFPDAEAIDKAADEAS